MTEVLRILVVAIFIFAFAVLLIVIPGNHFNDLACNKRAISFEQHEYSFIGGCMVKHNGKWLPLENIREFNNKE